MNRTLAARLGQEAVAIIRAGSYTAPSGRTVSIDVAPCVAGTRCYAPADALPAFEDARVETVIEATDESTLEAARRLRGEGLDVAALNFASARHAGGGFLSGALAQEESLARSSGLFACLEGQPMYARHEALRDPLYESWVIRSPAVPVFRTDSGELLEEPWPCTFLTSPAPNAKVARERGKGDLVRGALEERTARVLSVARAHGERALVLGAWGCGVFGNDPEVVAEVFQAALAGPFSGAFERVVFAVLDVTPQRANLSPFQRRFGA